ncbi:phosphate ABC transporter permease subunit PstC [Allofustis seminis]|uniref:phosphate ABC transporter permease subunit PstC n=1 Tax=Allofustis seminis TaxID=166939 RepID=UPI00037640BF|nr:phosphate ABC transporter permease subunit PstC [Allofustis seminis]
MNHSIKMKEKTMHYVFFISALMSVISLALIIYFIFSNGLPVMFRQGIGSFIFGKVWKPTSATPKYGLLPMVFGSLYVTLGATLIGVPIGVLTAIFMAEFCPKGLYRFLKPAISLMASIPSIVYGFFALQLLVPMVREIQGNGYSMLTAQLLLAIMILPTIIELSESSLRTVPRTYYHGSVGLGATHEHTVFHVMLPAAKSGVLSSVVLGIGRAIGETMAVVLVAGNQPVMPRGLFYGLRTLTTNIVMEMGYAAGEHREALIATSVVLFIFILIINSLFLYLKNKEAK